MKKDKILGVVLGIIFYTFSLTFFFCLYIAAVFVGYICDFSSILFLICYIIFPIIILIIPLIFKFALKKKFYKAIIYGFISIIIYILILIIIRFAIYSYFKTFTTEKWINTSWNSFRYIMIDDLEKKYTLEGMTKDEVYKLLGKEDRKSERLMGEYIISYSMRKGFLDGNAFNIYLNENNIVTKTDIIYLE